MLSLTQGETLLILVKRDGSPAEKIAKALKVDKSYLPKLYKMEFLPPKPLRMAKSLFSNSEHYFSETGQKTGMVEEPRAVYHTAAHAVEAAESAQLARENAALREEIAQLRRTIENLNIKNGQLTEAVFNLSKRS
jgi:hypothetical protein